MSTQDEYTTVLLRTMASDVAHELRGPVQSILVNLEVLRRRAQIGDSAAAIERADLIEEEIRRIHTVSDAFLGLLRPAEPEPRPLAAESLLATLDPLVTLHAKSARLKLERLPVDSGLFIRVRREPVSLALLHLFLAVCVASGPGATITLACAGDGGDVVFRIEAVAPTGEDAAAALDRAVAAAAAWLDDGGTVVCDPVSHNRAIVVRLRLPRATSLTPPSQPD